MSTITEKKCLISKRRFNVECKRLFMQKESILSATKVNFWILAILWKGNRVGADKGKMKLTIVK